MNMHHPEPPGLQMLRDRYFSDTGKLAAVFGGLPDPSRQLVVEWLERVSRTCLDALLERDRHGRVALLLDEYGERIERR